MLNQVKSARGGKLKIFYLIICNLLICTEYSGLLAQNITNTLGTSGLFSIKDGSTTYLSLSQSSGYLTLNRSINMPATTGQNFGVLYKDGYRFIHDYAPPNVGGSNTFIGINSGNFTMTGVPFTSDASYNTAVGNSALYSLTSGKFNSAFGRLSLLYNTIGARNSAFGTNSMLYNAGGSDNLAFGYDALYSNVSGSNNLAVGNESLSRNNASYNTAIGSYSLSANQSGYRNTAVGFKSLFSNDNGIQNTAVGDSSLYRNSSGNYSSAFGYASLTNNFGSSNSAFGYQSLFNNTTGTENTAVGYGSLYSNTVNGGNTAVGWNSLNSSTGWQNTSVGHHSLVSNTNGNYNTALGYNAGSTVTSGYNLTLLGIDANPTSPTANNQITLGNGFVSSLRCNVTTITSLSDARDKKNIKDLSLGLDFISKLKPRLFNWDKREWYGDNKSDGTKMQETPTAGFIAQELDEVQTTENAEWLNLVLKENPERWEATPGNLLPIMVKAIQELKDENDKLKNEIDDLKSVKEKITVLEQIINELKTNQQAVNISSEK